MERLQSVEVNDLHYSYKGAAAEAVAGLSLQVPAGKIAVLLGPNGSGKSTTFKILSTQLRPSKGEARVFGHSVLTECAKARSLMGVTFQSPSLDPLLTVQENLEIQAALYGLGSAVARARIDELLKLFRLEDRRDSRVKQLSGGLARRVELAKTLLPKPQLVLLDEPTVGLDPLLRFEFWQELRRLRDQGVSLLVTTHLMEEADLADEIFIINRGRLAAHGTPAALKAGLGAEVVVVDADGLETMEPALRNALGRFGKLSFVAGRMRLETAQPDEAFAAVRSALGARMHSMSLGKPTLGDVYLSATGDSL
ncbi:MAG: ABC transporter ATP-binding protein [Bdellovibrionales bacterium]|nr:ABC transporter ATP-binding protein [Bdellovibrionales bacterium]